MELVVERSDALHDGDVLGDLGQLARLLGRARRSSSASRVAMLGRERLGADVRARARARAGRRAARARPRRSDPRRRAGRTAGRKRRLLAQDRRVQRLQRGARLDAELVDAAPPRVLVGAQRLGLAARAVEGEHELAAQALAQGVRGDERLELADELGVAAELELGVVEVLESP